MKSWKAETYLMLVTLIWGGTFLFTKQALVDCSPSLFLVIRLLLAFTLTLIFFGKHLKHLNKEIFWHGTVLGLFFGVGFLLQTYGLKFTSVSKTAFITGITVSITPFVYFILQKKKIAFWSIIGVIIATIGLYIFTKPEFNNINIGDVLVLLSTFMWAFYITYMDIFTKDKVGVASTSLLVLLQFFYTFLLAVIALFIFDFGNLKLNFTNNLIFALIFNGILASFLVTFIHTAVQRYTSPVKAALIFSLEPVFAATFAIIFIDEVLSTREYLGGAILLIGVVVSELGYLLNPLFNKIGLLKS